MNKNNENILNIPIPPIGVPILTPSKPTTKVKSLKSMAKNAGNWVSESIKKPVKSAAKKRGKLGFRIY